MTLISLPATVFNPGGNITYLQLGLIGALPRALDRRAVAHPEVFRGGDLQPDDYMASALGTRARTITTVLFSSAACSGQAARVYLTGIVLQVAPYDEFAAFERATGVPGLWAAIAAIGVIRQDLLDLAGGMATVIWTDAVLFLIFLAAIVMSAFYAVTHVDGGVATVVELRRGEQVPLLRLRADLREGQHDLGCAVANTLVGVGVFGTDQLMAQRVFCCRNKRDAQKAMLASYASMAVAVAVALLGIALHAYYTQHPLSGTAAALYARSLDPHLPDLHR